MATTKPRTIIYKRAVFSDATLTLQTLLSAALTNKVDKADDRKEQFTDDVDVFRLVNKHSSLSDMIFGELVTYEPTKKQLKLDLTQKNAKFYPFEAQTPGSGKAFAEDVFYFGVRGNDLVCAQTRSMKAKEFEAHLYWLLSTCTKLIGGDVTLFLRDQPPDDIYSKVIRTSAKSMSIGTHILAAPVTEDSEPKERTETKKARFNLAGLSAEILKSIISPKDFNALNFTDDLDEANLRMTIELSFDRKTTEEGQKVIDKLATSFRNIDGSDFKLTLKDGTTINGDEMKMSGKITARYLESGLLDSSELYKAMRDWLVEKLVGKV